MGQTLSGIWSFMERAHSINEFGQEREHTDLTVISPRRAPTKEWFWNWPDASGEPLNKLLRI